MASVQPSKKWEIPARPKPGRKPLASTNPSNAATSSSGDSKSSQKAHRERKATYIAELEAKVRAYEVEDGSKAVFFQRVAQKLKLENDTLRALVKSLRTELEKRPSVSPPVATRASTKRSLPDDESDDAEDDGDEDEPDLKKPKMSPMSSPEFAQEDLPLNAASTPSSNGDPAVDTSAPPAATTNAPLSSISTLLSASEHEDGFFACGMCTSSTDGCACRDPLVALHVPQVKESPKPAPPTAFEASPLAAQPVASSSAAVVKMPISLKKKGGPSVWRLDVAPAATSAPSCSGNPRDCPACANDKQGQEFCRSLRSSVPPPRRRSSTLSGSSLRSEAPTPEDSAEKPIYCSDAWMELRSHPNIASANLNMLADIVSHNATEVRNSDGDKKDDKEPPVDQQTVQQQEQQQEWRRRLIIKRRGLDEAIRMLDQNNKS